MTEQSEKLQALETVNGTALAAYGERAEVRELANRMMKFHPAYKDVGEMGMIGAAQLAILSGANPLPTVGEIHVWKDWRGEITVMLGIAFWRRKAREVDAPVWFVDTADRDQDRRNYEPRPMTLEERRDHGVIEGDLAAICKAYRLSEYLKLIEAGIPWAAAQPMLTRTGIGIVGHDEMFARKDTKYRKLGDPLPPPNGRSWAWVAAKRAEQDVYRALSLINENFYQTERPEPAPAVTRAYQALGVENGNGRSRQPLDKLNAELFG